MQNGIILYIISVESAHLKNQGGIIKPHPYVELSVDDCKIHKTEVIKNTYQPKWNEQFTVYVYSDIINLYCIVVKISCTHIDYFISRLVTPYSMLHYRVYDYCKFQKDVLISQKHISLHDILYTYNGVCDNLELTIDLMRPRHHDHQASSSASSSNMVKVGELVTVLNGFHIDMALLVNPTRDGLEMPNNQGIFIDFLYHIING